LTASIESEGSPGRHKRVWLVTGASRGLGRAFTEAALDSGDCVAATARNPQALADLVDAHGSCVRALTLDVTDRAAVGDVVAETVEAFGRIDVLVNNAGFMLFGAIEELSESEVRRQLEVNFFGALWCTQAVLPSMRAQGRGWIVQVSSMAAIGPRLGSGMYSAAKGALEGFSESLAQEVEAFGITVTMLEPGRFRTDWNRDSMVQAAPMPEYEEVLRERRAGIEGGHDTPAGDPRGAGQALLKLLEADQPPLRVLLGSDAADAGPAVYRKQIEEWERWEALSRSAASAGR
jgi:NAD(P)-dependent dehydrogenase (short-subunit alcohol dehydrogenase family)